MPNLIFQTSQCPQLDHLDHIPTWYYDISSGTQKFGRLDPCVLSWIGQDAKTSLILQDRCLHDPVRQSTSVLQYGLVV